MKITAPDNMLNHFIVLAKQNGYSIKFKTTGEYVMVKNPLPTVFKAKPSEPFSTSK